MSGASGCQPAARARVRQGGGSGRASGARIARSRRARWRARRLAMAEDRWTHRGKRRRKWVSLIRADAHSTRTFAKPQVRRPKAGQGKACNGAEGGYECGT